MSKLLYRSAYLRAAPEAGSRKATFVAATESPVDTGFGPEVLRMSGVDLDAYGRNPVALDSHRRGSIRDVIGQASVRVEGDQLIAEIDYLDDEDGERALSKVRAGAIRAVSIGYAVEEQDVRQVRAGEEAEGVKGPAMIVDRWRLVEVSNVPVPADSLAVARAFYTRAAREEDPPMESMDEQAERLGLSREEAGEALEEAAERKRKRMEDGESDEERADDESDSSEDEEPADSEDEESSDMEEERAAYLRAAPKSLRDLAEIEFLSETPVEKVRTWRDVLAIAPSWAKEDAERLIRESPRASLKDHRAALLALRSTPAGSAPPADETAPAEKPSAPDYSRLLFG